MSKRIKARLERLEAIETDYDGPRTIIFVSPGDDDLITGLVSDDIVLTRKPGESLEALENRAGLVPPPPGHLLRLWTAQLQADYDAGGKPCA